MSLCRFCKKAISDGIHLSDGGMIHKSCLDIIQRQEHEIQLKLDGQQDKVNRLELKIKRRKGLGFMIVSMFSTPKVATVDLQREISTIKENIVQLSSSIFLYKKRSALIYDYFLTYPPDWEERRIQVAERDGDNCNNCGKSWRLHLHHSKPLSKGGTNKISNLKLLCATCHSKKHGKRKFSDEFRNSETAFSKRVANIRYAIENDKRIKFGYKKYTEKTHKQRTVKPAKLVSLDHKRNSGSTLCVNGYCELRKAERTFALKRMRGLKVI